MHPPLLSFPRPPNSILRLRNHIFPCVHLLPVALTAFYTFFAQKQIFSLVFLCSNSVNLLSLHIPPNEIPISKMTFTDRETLLRNFHLVVGFVQMFTNCGTTFFNKKISIYKLWYHENLQTVVSLQKILLISAGSWDVSFLTTASTTISLCTVFLTF